MKEPTRRIKQKEQVASPKGKRLGGDLKEDRAIFQGRKNRKPRKRKISRTGLKKSAKSSHKDKKIQKRARRLSGGKSPQINTPGKGLKRPHGEEKTFSEKKNYGEKDGR